MVAPILAFAQVPQNRVSGGADQTLSVLTAALGVIRSSLDSNECCHGLESQPKAAFGNYAHMLRFKLEEGDPPTPSHLGSDTWIEQIGDRLNPLIRVFPKALEHVTGEKILSLDLAVRTLVHELAHLVVPTTIESVYEREELAWKIIHPILDFVRKKQREEESQLEKILEAMNGKLFFQKEGGNYPKCFFQAKFSANPRGRSVAVSFTSDHSGMFPIYNPCPIEDSNRHQDPIRLGVTLNYICGIQSGRMICRIASEQFPRPYEVENQMLLEIFDTGTFSTKFIFGGVTPIKSFPAQYILESRKK